MLFSWCPAEGSGSEREIKVAFNHRLPAGLLTFDPSLQPQGLAPQQSRSSQWDSKGWQTVIARHAEDPRGRRGHRCIGGVAGFCWAQLIPSGALRKLSHNQSTKKPIEKQIVLTIKAHVSNTTACYISILCCDLLVLGFGNNTVNFC